ncbi:MAG TPA: protein translocase subunit SecD [candidate division Zixibacteria bacterium]|nr:protein translocase subunit SecD [candidate division Zixibacteria bacterium]
MRGAQAWRMIITVLLVILSLYFLYPTLRLSFMSEDEKLMRPELEERLSAKSIKLGLDLQGGMHLLLEPDLVTLLSSRALKRDGQLLTALRETKRLSEQQNRDFLEVMPGVFRRQGLELTEYFSNLGGNEGEIIRAIREERIRSIDGALEVVRSRIDQYGVSEPVIQTVGSDRIVVELPGVQDAEQARSLIKETAILKFQLVRRDRDVQQAIERIDALLRDRPELLASVYRTHLEDDFETMPKVESHPEDADRTSREVDEAEESDVPPSDLMAADDAIEEEPAEDAPAIADIFGDDESGIITSEDLPFSTDDIEVSRPFSSLVEVSGDVIMVPRSEFNTVSRIIRLPEILDVLPRGTEFVWGARDEFARGVRYRFLYLLNDKVELTGDRVSKANFGFGNDGRPVVNLGFDAQGGRMFAQVTGANIGRQLAIILNEQVYSAPNIKNKIEGDAQITGIPSLDEAKLISIILRAGSLPVPLDIKSERTVGPSLGEDSIRKGVMATVFGAILVALFMIIYYKMAGVIANLAFILNLIALMAGMAAFGATLTLPGIAGIILTIGMAVDANVLIFERIREELRSGKTVRTAIDAGYSRAFRTIVDANITTLITAAILFMVGTGPVQGFAVTLFMGIIISMITAIVVTRLIFEFITSRRHIEKLSI